MKYVATSVSHNTLCNNETHIAQDLREPGTVPRVCDFAKIKISHISAYRRTNADIVYRSTELLCGLSMYFSKYNKLPRKLRSPPKNGIVGSRVNVL